ncbi:type III secretion system translocon subunit SctE [Pandoraea pnomenusa]|uniref:type III secretion system translocon subunit SctE n=1 Tax=Pandoraea pnomenusa TaxID=93220 RepID=UPI0003C7586D|nr:type III secretion system translocon subunit SctE [Pandoraea pnomenusa]AHB08718.1 hypothetical protein U875_22770 [Pandoraea pnomenusa 3kgm]
MTITLAPGLPPILPTLDKALDETLRSDKPDPGASDRPASLRRLALEGIARTDANDRNPSLNADTPELEPPPNSTRANLTLLLGRMREIMGSSSLSELQNRLAQWEAQSAAQQALADARGEAFKEALAEAQKALEALKAAMDALAQAQDALERARSRLSQAKARLDGLTPGTPEHDAALAEYDAAKSELEGATSRYQSARTAVDGAYDAAKDAMKRSDDAFETLSNDGVRQPGDKDKQYLDDLDELFRLMGLFAKLLGDSAVKGIEEDMKFFDALRKTRENDMQRQNEEYRKKVEKAGFLGKLFGVIGKVVGAVLAVVGVLGAVFTGGASMAMTVVGVALLADSVIGAATGFSVVSEALKPVMTHIVQPLASLIGDGISGLLEKAGVPKDTADMIGGVVGAVVAAVVVVALIAVAVVVGGGTAAARLGRMLGDLAGDLLKKIVPDLAREALKSGASMVTNQFAALATKIGLKEGNARVFANMLESILKVGELGLGATQTGGQTAIGILDKEAADIRADLSVSQEVLENVKDSVKQAADRFAGTEGVISRLVSQMSDAAKAKYEAQRFALNHVRA